MTSRALRMAGRFCRREKERKGRVARKQQVEKEGKTRSALVLFSDRVEGMDVWKRCTYVGIELDIDDGTNDGLDVSGSELGLGSVGSG